MQPCLTAIQSQSQCSRTQEQSLAKIPITCRAMGPAAGSAEEAMASPTAAMTLAHARLLQCHVSASSSSCSSCTRALQ